MKLLVHPTPYPDESLRGYEWRLAASNGFISPAEMLSVLSHRTSKAPSINTLIRENIATWCADAILSKKPRCHWRYTLSSNYRICPKCVEESPYLRESWDYALLPYCFKHNRYLTDLNQSPYRILSPLESFIVTDSDVVEQDRSDAEMIHVIQRSLGFASSCKISDWKIISSMNANDLQYLVILIGAYVAFKEKYQPRKAPIKYSISNARAVLENATQILRDWPRNISQLIKIPSRELLQSRQITQFLSSCINT